MHYQKITKHVIKGEGNQRNHRLGSPTNLCWNGRLHFMDGWTWTNTLYAYACLSDKRKRAIYNVERKKLLCKKCPHMVQRTSSVSDEVQLGQSHSKTSRLFEKKMAINYSSRVEHHSSIEYQ